MKIYIYRYTHMYRMYREREGEKEREYKGHLCKTAGWHIANNMVNVSVMKLNLQSLHCVKHSLLSWQVLCSSWERRESQGKWWNGQNAFLMHCKKYRVNFNLNSFSYVLFHLVRKCLEDTSFFIIAKQLKRQYFHIWLSVDKTMFDFLVKAMYSAWMWAPSLKTANTYSTNV